MPEKLKSKDADSIATGLEFLGHFQIIQNRHYVNVLEFIIHGNCSSTKSRRSSKELRPNVDRAAVTGG